MSSMRLSKLDDPDADATSEESDVGLPMGGDPWEEFAPPDGALPSSSSHDGFPPGPSASAAEARPRTCCRRSLLSWHGLAFAGRAWPGSSCTSCCRSFFLVFAYEGCFARIW